jgi:hypothetical protein
MMVAQMKANAAALRRRRRNRRRIRRQRPCLVFFAEAMINRILQFSN